MQNVMRVPSAACVNFQGWGKFLVLSIQCFVMKLLFVSLLSSFQFNFVGEIRYYWDLWGKMGEKGCNFR